MTAKVQVDLPGRAYDILIGPGTLAEAGTRIAAMGGRKHVTILTDETVAGLHLDTLQQTLRAAGLTSAALALPPGEATKCWAELERAVVAGPEGGAGRYRWRLWRWGDR